MPTGPSEGIVFKRLSLEDPLPISDEAYREAAKETLSARIPGVGEQFAVQVIETKPTLDDDLKEIDYIGETRAEAIWEAIEADKVL